MNKGNCNSCVYRELEGPCPREKNGKCEYALSSNKRKKFWIHDMDITFEEGISYEEMEMRFFSALRNIGVIGHRGGPA